MLKSHSLGAQQQPGCIPSERRSDAATSRDGEEWRLGGGDGDTRDAGTRGCDPAPDPGRGWTQVGAAGDRTERETEARPLLGSHWLRNLHRVWIKNCLEVPSMVKTFFFYLLLLILRITNKVRIRDFIRSINCLELSKSNYLIKYKIQKYLILKMALLG